MQNTKNENNTNLSQCLARQWIGPLLLCSKPPQGSLITMLRAVLAIVIGLQFFLEPLLVSVHWNSCRKQVSSWAIFEFTLFVSIYRGFLVILICIVSSCGWNKIWCPFSGWSTSNSKLGFYGSVWAVLVGIYSWLHKWPVRIERDSFALNELLCVLLFTDEQYSWKHLGDCKRPPRQPLLSFSFRSSGLLILEVCIAHILH